MSRVLRLGCVGFIFSQGILLNFLIFLASIGYRIVIEAPQWYIDLLTHFGFTIEYIR